MNNSEKIGLGILTFQRKEYFTKVLASIPKDRIDELVIVNDGTPYGDTDIGNTKLIQHTENKGIAISKNDALRYLIQKECKHLFLIEDDIIIKDPNVFDTYIKHAYTTGLYHLNFEQVGNNHKRLSFQYGNDIGIELYKNPQGAFSYIYAGIIVKLDGFNENYKNAFEHVEFAYRLIQHNLLPPFWFFPDIMDSNKYLEPVEGSIENSTITDKPLYQENWNNSAQYFIQQHGHFTNEIPDTPTNKVLSKLIEIQKIYGQGTTSESLPLLK